MVFSPVGHVGRMKPCQMMITLSRLYPDGAHARAVMDELKAAGLAEDDVGVIAPSRGAAGLLAGSCAFVLPGIGAVVAGGWLAAALAGAVAGGIAGGVAGALVEAGIGSKDAGTFADGIKRGGTLLAIRVMDQDRAFHEEILESNAVRPIGIAPMQLGNVGPLHVKRP